MTEYATFDEMKYSLELTNTAHADGDIPRALQAAAAGIDEVVGRSFTVDDDATAIRWYSPTAVLTLEIHDLVVLTTLKTDENGDGVFERTWTLNRDFVLEPLNALAEGFPYERVRVHRLGGMGGLPCHERSVQVTGQFGWSAVPAAINEASLIIATRLLKRNREAPFGIVAIGLDGAAVHIARSDPDVKFLLKPYERNYRFA